MAVQVCRFLLGNGDIAVENSCVKFTHCFYFTELSRQTRARSEACGLHTDVCPASGEFREHRFSILCF